jgi:hypothetical protein
MQWILDVLGCNALGIYIGMKLVDYFGLGRHDWRGLYMTKTAG